MINYYRIKHNTIVCKSGNKLTDPNIIWVDLINATEEEKQLVEKTFTIQLFTKQESAEIETSSRYNENGEEIGINLNFTLFRDSGFSKETVSFLIKNKLLISQREGQYRTFDDVIKKLPIMKPLDGDDIFLLLLETRIDYDADLIETVTGLTNAVGDEMTKTKQLARDLLLRITNLQNITIAIRENITEKQRVLSAMLKSKFFPKEDEHIMHIMLNDVNSLLDHTSFNFERLEFLQNSFLGLVDMEQNRIIKLFTVLTVIFMPPTLIASMYGMNFKFMPELEKIWGYPFALLMMVSSSVLTLLFFKKKKWL